MTLPIALPFVLFFLLIIALYRLVLVASSPSDWIKGYSGRCWRIFFTLQFVGWICSRWYEISEEVKSWLRGKILKWSPLKMAFETSGVEITTVTLHQETWPSGHVVMTLEGRWGGGKGDMIWSDPIRARTFEVVVRRSNPPKVDGPWRNLPLIGVESPPRGLARAELVHQQRGNSACLSSDLGLANNTRQLPTRKVPVKLFFVCIVRVPCLYFHHRHDVCLVRPVGNRPSLYNTIYQSSEFIFILFTSRLCRRWSGPDTRREITKERAPGFQI